MENRTSKQRIVYWKKMVAKFRSSDLSGSEFSKKNNISAHQLSYWKTKFIEVKPKLEQMPFVEIKKSIVAKNEVSLSINDIITINFNNPPSIEWISELIHSVKQAV